jgi:hypothetical protein
MRRLKTLNLPDRNNNLLLSADYRNNEKRLEGKKPQVFFFIEKQSENDFCRKQIIFALR